MSDFGGQSHTAFKHVPGSVQSHQLNVHNQVKDQIPLFRFAEADAHFKVTGLHPPMTGI